MPSAICSLRVMIRHNNKLGRFMPESMKTNGEAAFK